ncbi:MAG: LCP family protein [Candidatus Spechtbacterales bacterium]
MMNTTTDYQLEKPRKKSRKKILILSIFVLFVTSVLGLMFYKTSNVFTIAGNSEDVGTYDDFELKKEKDRLDILVLGIRGAGDANGGLLADTMVLISFDKAKQKTAMISLPRDLYIEMPDHNVPEKINFAYALGEERRRGGGGLALSKEVVRYATGVYVDHAIVVNFDGFKEIVDIMGGVEIYRDTPFYEAQQWQGEGKPNSKYWYLAEGEVPGSQTEGDTADEEDGENTNFSSEQDVLPDKYWVFNVPKGYSVLNSEDALYYARSRYSSSDFDRMRRQQQIVSSLKSKALSLGVLANPIKIFDILDSLGRNVRTDMGLGDLREVITLAQDYAQVPVQSVLLEPAENGLIEPANINGAYVLLPRARDFSEIRTFFQNIFED